MKKKKAVMTGFEKRAVAIFASVCLCMAGAAGRIAKIQTDTFATAAAGQDTRRLLLAESRGAIFDRNGVLLVNGTEKRVSAVLCCESTKPFCGEDYSPGKVVLTDEAVPDNTPFSVSADIRERYGTKQLCRHVIGYTDADGNGVCGVEKAFDRLLRDAGGKLYAEYTVDAHGNALPGKGLAAVNDNYASPAGLALTVDAGIQEIAENALKNSEIEKGAVVVMDCRSFEILAAASVPVYDVNDVAASLGAEDSPFLDRCFSAYPVGSVFKPFLAAAALMNGADAGEKFVCTGAIRAGGQSFRCFNGRSHGEETLFEAVENSCNAYFIDLGLKTGKQAILSLCRELGFGTETELFPETVSAAGNLPEEKSVLGEAQLANLCFGQGELLATPLQMAAAYSVIACGGEYREPYILYRLYDEKGEAYGYYRSEVCRQVLPKEVCDTLGICLYNNMLNGTGVNGRPSRTQAAGKTATAQTGEYDENGRERLCTWFAGYFPFDAPQYTVVVFNEDGSTASADCAPVFRETADNIAELCAFR